MSAAPAPPLGDQVRGLRRELQEATAEKIAQVVAMVDALPQRGAAEALIEPLRPRMAAMRVPRPLGLTRLLFMPLDPVLVAAREWRRGSPGIPRTAIAPLAALVRAGLPGSGLAALEARLLGRDRSDRAAVSEGGRWLWPRAASLLAAAMMPATWESEAGLGCADFAPLCRLVAGTLAAAELLDAAAEGAAGPAALEPAALEPAALAAKLLAATDGRPVGSLLAVILTRIGDAAAVLDAMEAQAADATRPSLRQARAEAVGFLLDRLGDPPGLRGSVAQADDEARRGVALLETLAARVSALPSLQGRLREARRALDEGCQRRFRAGLDEELALPAAAAQAMTDEAVEGLERTARDLHHLAQTARQIGSPSFYEAALHAAVVRLGQADGSGLSRVERARLVELLAGPGEAEAFLAAGG